MRENKGEWEMRTGGRQKIVIPSQAQRLISSAVMRNDSSTGPGKNSVFGGVVGKTVPMGG